MVGQQFIETFSGHLESGVQQQANDWIRDNPDWFAVSISLTSDVQTRSSSTSDPETYYHTEVYSSFVLAMLVQQSD